MKDIGYGKGYKKYDKESYLPDKLKIKVYKGVKNDSMLLKEQLFIQSHDKIS